jgi:hypothetical protein
MEIQMEFSPETHLLHFFDNGRSIGNGLLSRQSATERRTISRIQTKPLAGSSIGCPWQSDHHIEVYGKKFINKTPYLLNMFPFIRIGQ